MIALGIKQVYYTVQETANTVAPLIAIFGGALEVTSLGFAHI